MWEEGEVPEGTTAGLGPKGGEVVVCNLQTSGEDCEKDEGAVKVGGETEVGRLERKTRDWGVWVGG